MIDPATLTNRIAELEAENERLRVCGPLWLQHAIAMMHDMVDQTDPRCPIGSALTRAGLERRPDGGGLLEGELRQQLAAMTAARDEACEIAHGALVSLVKADGEYDEAAKVEIDCITTLRNVGKEQR